MAEALCNVETDDKIKLVQKLLYEGKPRFEVARSAGYKGVDGLDRYAKNRGYAWNTKTKNYELKEGLKEELTVNPPERVMRILSAFEKGIETSDIVKLCRFKNVQELAEYMKERGYIWDIEVNTYVKKNTATYPTENESLTISYKTDSIKSKDDLLNYLMENREKIFELITSDSVVKESCIVPKYVIRGTTTTKSFCIIDSIDRMIKDYCNEMNITQKELLHSALIDFFNHYGYKKEIETLLR